MYAQVPDAPLTVPTWALGWPRPEEGGPDEGGPEDQKAEAPRRGAADYSAAAAAAWTADRTAAFAARKQVNAILFIFFTQKIIFS